MGVKYFEDLNNFKLILEENKLCIFVIDNVDGMFEKKIFIGYIYW